MDLRREAFNGELNWVEINTTDVKATQDFMLQVLDYEVIEHNDEIGYTQLGKDGFRYMGLSEIKEGPYDDVYKREKEVVGTKCFFATEDTEKTCELVRANGGTVVTEPLDVMGSGIMATFLDPEGTPFGCWQPLSHRGMMKYVNDDWQLGAISWVENCCVDSSVTKPFYCAVLGAKCLLVPPENYEMLVLNEEDIFMGGLMKTESDDDRKWVFYINVKDVNECCEKAKELGGKVTLGPMVFPGMMHIATVVDSVGVSFSICSEEGSRIERLTSSRKKAVKYLRMLDSTNETLTAIKSLAESNEPDLSSKIHELLNTKSLKKRSREDDSDENPIQKKSRSDEE